MDLFDDAELIEVETVLTSDTIAIGRSDSTPETQARWSVLKAKKEGATAGRPIALHQDGDHRIRPVSMDMTDEAFEDLRATLEWGSKLELTDEQRAALSGFCCKIGKCVPSARLKEEAEKKRAAHEPLKALEQRVSELERALKASRQEWVFRRAKSR
jgi:hypothetical protein